MNSTLANSSYIGYSEKSFVLINLVKCILILHFTVGFSLNCCIIFFKGGAVDGFAFFVLNNAAAEILFCISSLLSFVLYEHIFSTLFKLFTFLFGASMTARVLFQCCVSLERYLAVVHPVTFLRFKPLRYHVACSVSAWICALVLGVSACTLLSAYTLLVAENIIVLAVEFFCCVSILKKLRHPGPRDTEHNHREMSAIKKKAFQIVSINLLTSLTQSAPVAVSCSLENLLSYYDFSMVTAICIAINTFVGFMQPVFILHKVGKLSFKCS